MHHTATDLDGQFLEAPGYDAQSGSGRINAGAAMAALEYPYYRIRHIDAAHYVTSSTSSAAMIVNNQLKHFQGDGIVSENLYFMHVYEKLTTLYYSLGPTEQVIGAWPFYKGSTGTAFYGNTIQTDETWYCEIVSYSNTQAVLKTYSCKINTNQLGQIINYYYPCDIWQTKSGICLYTYDPNAVDVKDYTEIEYFRVYPIPAIDQVTIAFNCRLTQKGELTVYDLGGRIVYKETSLDFHVGVNRHKIDLKELGNGIYFVNITFSDNRTLTNKLIIQK